MGEIFEVEEIIVTSVGKTYLLTGVRIRDMNQEPVIKLQNVNFQYQPNDYFRIKFPEGKRKIKLERTAKGYVLKDLNNKG